MKLDEIDISVSASTTKPNEIYNYDEMKMRKYHLHTIINNPDPPTHP